MHATFVLKADADAGTRVTTSGSKAVLEVFVVKKVLNRAEQANRHTVVPEWKRVTGGDVGPPVSAKSERVPGEILAIEYGSQVGTRRQQIEGYPQSIEPMRRNERELMIGNTKDLSVEAD